MDVRLADVGDSHTGLGRHREDPVDVPLRVDDDRDFAVVGE